MKELQDTIGPKVKKHNEKIVSFTIAVTIFILLSVIGFFYLFFKEILNSLQNFQNGLLNFFRYLSGQESEFKPIKVDTYDEIGQMSKIINRSISITKEIFDEKKRLYDLTIEQSLKDSLTNVENRKSYGIKIEEHINEFYRYKIPFCLVFTDIDDFKKINDNYGHQIGDEVLIEFTSLIKKELRANDFIFRMGGEEFLILLSNTNLENAKIVVNKLLNTIRSKLKVKDKEKVTASFGLTAFNDGDNENSVYKRCDSLMYKSKNSGKDMVTIG